MTKEDPMRAMRTLDENKEVRVETDPIRWWAWFTSYRDDEPIDHGEETVQIIFRPVGPGGSCPWDLVVDRKDKTRRDTRNFATLAEAQAARDKILEGMGAL